MSNIYHLLYQLPSLEEEDTYIEVEELARRLVESGRFRVDIDYNTLNFSRFSLPYERVDLIFSRRELYDPPLLVRTEQRISHALLRKHPAKESRAALVQAKIAQLRAQLAKYQPVPADIEMKLARVVVQSTHPVVMLLLLWEGVEVFVSYSHVIGDLLTMSSWQSSQYNSGMQSTDGRSVAVYISAGGDPFGKAEEGATYGNGLPALARMMVIGGQELGHYSDIMRDARGRQISRHSADFNATKAKDNVLYGRRNDIIAVRKLEGMLKQLGLHALYESEREERFYHKIGRKGIKLWFLKRKIRRSTKRFLHKCRKEKILFPHSLHPEQGHFATHITMALADMKFNLAPKADAYARADPVEEEAIACVEALARVPQQVIKWGEPMTRAMMPNLYTIYYNQVIPACITVYENISGAPYHFTFTRKTIPFSQKLWRKIKKLGTRRKKESKEGFA